MENTKIWGDLLMALLVINTLTKSWLDKKNRMHIIKHSVEVPEMFAEKISIDEHQKAASYSCAKLITGHFFRLYSLFIFCGWIFLGGLEKLDIIVRSFGLSPLLTGLAFFGIFSVIGTLIDLPQSIYTTFFLEEKYGFNKTTPKTFVIDAIKGIVLSIVIGAPLLAAILGIMEYLGATWWVWAWAVLITFQLTLMWAYPRFIAPMFNKFEELPEGEVKDKVLALLERCDFTSSGLFVMDASKRSAHGNAYFTGFGKTKRIVFFDTLINTLEPIEIEAVLAHELGHFKLKHITKKMASMFLMSFLGFAVLGIASNNIVFFNAHHVSAQSNYMALVLFSLIVPVYMFFITPVMAMFSRKHEFEADDFAKKHSDANALVSALVKMHKDNASTLTPDPTYASFYYSHPPAVIRINNLLK